MKTLILAVMGFLLGAQAASATEPDWIVLKDGQTKTSDGFSVKASAGPQHYTPTGKKPSAMIWYTLSVPRFVRNTFLTSCDLWVQDQQGHVACSASLVHSTGQPGHTPGVVQTKIEGRFAKQCEVHFQYGEQPVGNTVKIYVLPCSQILPSKPKA